MKLPEGNDFTYAVILLRRGSGVPVQALPPPNMFKLFHLGTHCTGPCPSLWGICKLVQIAPNCTTVPPPKDMFQLVQLGPHGTASPNTHTHSNLFTMKHGLSKSGRLAFDLNAFLFHILLIRNIQQSHLKKLTTFLTNN